MTFHGGAILANPLIALVVVGLPVPSTRLLENHTSHLGAYGVQASRVDTVLSLPRQPVADPERFLRDLVAAGRLPPPDGYRRLYLLLVPGQGNYHSWWMHAWPVGAPYGVAENLAGLTHELAEATTDPFFSGWYDGQPGGGECCDSGKVVNLAGEWVARADLWDGPFTPAPPPYLLWEAAWAYQEALEDWLAGDHLGAAWAWMECQIDVLEAGAL
jgi:hypothetical protein